MPTSSRLSKIFYSVLLYSSYFTTSNGLQTTFFSHECIQRLTEHQRKQLQIEQHILDTTAGKQLS
jgi:hypothetical protein